jgi:hypothetical protein
VDVIFAYASLIVNTNYNCLASNLTGIILRKTYNLSFILKSNKLATPTITTITTTTTKAITSIDAHLFNFFENRI